MRRVSSLIAEYEEIFHVLSLIGKRHSCLSVVFLTHSLGYDLEIGHHVFPPPGQMFYPLVLRHLDMLPQNGNNS